ncbi:Zn 2cys6 transcription factor [Fusarium mexicanum]|uniref:Zn 2cys6 transcription factor n=1 Tax=Fusarium mexicanum TaxID=751941 RepID=A0A8H5MIC7_9HYPO|nr:Zn 2cys6 transcription factor [Fusarium mexicanum]
MESDSPSNLRPPGPPAGGRQVKACSACRTTKIKCKMTNGVPPCDRCRARGLTCQYEKNAQSILEETNRSQTEMSGQISQLRTAVDVLLRMSNLPPLSSYNLSSPTSLEQDISGTADDDASREDRDESLPLAPILAPLTTEDEGLYSLPINSLYEVTKFPSLRNPKPVSRSGAIAHDFISRGLISEPVAQQLFLRFRDRINFFCYGILCPHDSLESLRKSSTALTAAICAVASLHDPEGSNNCKVCHAEFLKTISSSMFSISHTTDDIRALIVGAYWLGNVSYTLLGHAVRIAMRLNYHLCYFSVIKDPSQQGEVEKARLWYTLYVMDHHSSILYGRPAMISPREEPHQQWELFIQTNGNSKVKDVFGGYSIKPVPEHCMPQLSNFFSELDRWYMVWGNRMPQNAHVGWFPRDGAILHYHFARLHLCSYIFRGMSPESLAIASIQVKDYAALAFTSATAVLDIVIEREDMRMALVGMPVYFHGMITFAAVFLVKATRSDFWGLTPTHAPKTLELVERYIQELRQHSAARQHLVYHLSTGLESMVIASKRLLTKDLPDLNMPSTQEEALPTMDSMFVMDTFDFLQTPIDPQDLSSLSSQEYSWDHSYDLMQ